MKKYILSCCSTADLTREHFERRNISYICFHFAIDGVEYMDDLGKTMPFGEFYARMSEGADTRTSQVNISEYVDYFSAFAEDGKDIVHICLSSGISGTINSARNAALIIKERYPDCDIRILDSLAASSGFGLLMDAAADRRDEGMGIDELVEWFEENKLRMHHWFFSTDLSAYVRGGRISKTAAVFGGLLDICPLLNMDNLGRLIPRAKILGKKKVIIEIVKAMEQNDENGPDYYGKCYISNSACYEDARKVADMIQERFPKLDGKVQIYSVGTTIGAHTGPGTVALFFWGKERKN